MSPLATLFTLAQTSVPSSQGGQPLPGPLAAIFQYAPYIFMALIIYFVVIRGKKRQNTQARDMLTNMKKGDRVQTIGGIIGTLVEVRETEVVLKVDETSNTKMRFVRKAIAHVFSDEVKDEKAK